eukprot:TRINITY_DN4326_c0_g1_i1.p2 TRINITY_DN4326_c0_g1~~TRINITY_DN4326_c0_g1_i1.p2  ORF type:complete len:52 (-),score=8.44 TRINITY_DN4326_c0_g1_i1:239-394(-)
MKLGSKFTGWVTILLFVDNSLKQMQKFVGVTMPAEYHNFVKCAATPAIKDQ